MTPENPVMWTIMLHWGEERPDRDVINIILNHTVILSFKLLHVLKKKTGIKTRTHSQTGLGRLSSLYVSIMRIILHVHTK
jgi:hypothetical protein